MSQKAKVRYMGGVVCNSSTVDQATQNLSAFNVIDQITVAAKRKGMSKPVNPQEQITVPINFQVVTLWKRSNLADQGKDIVAKIEAEILDGSEQVLGKTVFEFQMPATAIRFRYILNVQGLPVTSSGEYCFQFRSIEDNGEKSDALAKLCLDVIVNRE